MAEILARDQQQEQLDMRRRQQQQQEQQRQLEVQRFQQQQLEAQRIQQQRQLEAQRIQQRAEAERQRVNQFMRNQRALNIGDRYYVLLQDGTDVQVQRARNNQPWYFWVDLADPSKGVGQLYMRDPGNVQAGLYFMWDSVDPSRAMTPPGVRAAVSAERFLPRAREVDSRKRDEEEQRRKRRVVEQEERERRIEDDLRRRKEEENRRKEDELRMRNRDQERRRRADEEKRQKERALPMLDKDAALVALDQTIGQLEANAEQLRQKVENLKTLRSTPTQTLERDQETIREDLVIAEKGLDFYRLKRLRLERQIQDDIARRVKEEKRQFALKRERELMDQARSRLDQAEEEERRKAEEVRQKRQAIRESKPSRVIRRATQDLTTAESASREMERRVAQNRLMKRILEQVDQRLFSDRKRRVRTLDEFIASLPNTRDTLGEVRPEMSLRQYAGQQELPTIQGVPVDPEETDLSVAFQQVLARAYLCGVQSDGGYFQKHLGVPTDECPIKPVEN